MPSHSKQVRIVHYENDPTPWLLDVDPDNPSIRYYALRDLLNMPEDDPEMGRARRAIMESGPVPVILGAQQPDGSWNPKSGKYPDSVWHYQSTWWQVVFLAELGADPGDERVRRGCEFILSHYLAENHAFSGSTPPIPSRVVHCMNGLIVWALAQLGYLKDERLRIAIEWIVNAITGDSPELKYYKSGTSGPLFACGVNLKQPCAWGGAKAMRALAAIPLERRNPAIQKAIQVGTDFLLSRDLAVADYPYTERVSATWFKLGFPLSYWSDVLEAAGVLVDLGYGNDPRLEGVKRLIGDKRDENGRWNLENTLNGKTWVDIEEKGKPSKWITLRAMKVLRLK